MLSAAMLPAPQIYLIR
uniref:Uncharacterized protein n=1 Tax=Arundo donax TaxID=35708 RepID=A0A0A8YWZ5_ARUDO